MAAEVFAIECWGPNNDNIVFATGNGVGARLRGRWDRGVVSHKAKGEHLDAFVMAIQYVPGQIIHLDVKRGEGKIIDPLAETAEGKRILADINKVYSQYRAEFGSTVQAHPTQTHKLDINGVKSWAFYMRQLLDTNMARPVPTTAQLPPADVIRGWPGARWNEPMSTRPKMAKSAEEARNHPHLLYQWADEVPVGDGKGGKGELVGAGAGGEAGK